MYLRVIQRMLIAFCSLWKVASSLTEGCYKDIVDGLDRTIVPLDILQGEDINPQECRISCLKETFQIAVIVQTQFCLCTDTDFSPAVTSENCDDVTSTSVQLYEGGNLSLDFNITLVDVDMSAGTTEVHIEKESEHLECSLDFGGPPSTKNTQNVLVFQNYKIPGTYILKVTCTVPYTDSQLTKISEVTIPITNETQGLDPVECPVVSEPLVPFACNISGQFPEGVEVKAAFNGSGLEGNQTFLAPLAPEYEVIPSLAPRPGDGGGVVGAIPTNTTHDVIMYQHPIRTSGVVVSVEFSLSYVDYTTAGILRPICLDGTYCMALGGCALACPHNQEYDLFSCTETQAFCPLRGTCAATAPSACVAPGEANDWESIPLFEGTPADNLTYFEVSQEVLPGDVFFITGPVLRRAPEAESSPTDAPPEGDTVDGVQTNYQHFFSAVVKHPTKLQLNHTCQVVGEDVVFTVLDAVTNETLGSAVTSCERVIENITFSVSQLETEEFNPFINLEPPFYVRSDVEFNLSVYLKQSGPMDLNFTIPTIDHITPFTIPEDLPGEQDTHILNLTAHVEIPGVFIAYLEGRNKHNLNSDPVMSFVDLYVQHPVVQTWEMWADDEIFAFKIPSEEASFRFNDTEGKPFPTNATAFISWGDTTGGEIVSFDDPGDKSPVFNHTYTEDGVYTVEVFIFNEVSGCNITCNVTIVEEIKDLHMYNRYFPTLAFTEERKGFGPDNNIFPRDKNVSFFPVLTRGTIYSYEVRNVTTNETIFTHQVPDPFDPMSQPFHYNFPREGFVNVSVTAFNLFESVTVELFFEISGIVRGLELFDFGEVKPMGHVQTVQVNLVSLGVETCLMLAWGDRSQFEFLGDESICASKYEMEFFSDRPLELQMNFTHVYMKNGVFNITAVAFNRVSVETRTLMFIVSDYACNPPSVSIVGQARYYLHAIRVKKSRENAFFTKALVNCKLTLKTRKRWQIYRVEEAMGELRQPVRVDVIPSRNKSELILPPYFLDHGYYMLVYTLDMWDPQFLPIDIPFQKQTHTYIKVEHSPLIPTMLRNAVSRVTIGINQVVAFEPALLTVDPDNPEAENQGYSVRWRCRRTRENWPESRHEYPKPIKPLNGSAGCFGYGPGYLTYTGGALELYGFDFWNNETLYEMEAEVSKDTRNVFVYGQVMLVPYLVPILELKCARPEFCHPFSKGVYVNPFYRLPLSVRCLKECGEPLTYKWTLTDERGNEYANGSEYFVLGTTSNETAFDPVFFKDYGTVKTVHLGVSVTNGGGYVGRSTYFMRKNEGPQHGSCALDRPEDNLALESVYTLRCWNWRDPEDIGVKDYTVYREMESMLHHKSQPITVQEMKLAFPPGVFKVIVRIKDLWDSYTDHDIVEALEIRMPTKEAYKAMDVKLKLARAIGQDDTGLIMQWSSAAVAIAQQAEWLQLEGTSGGQLEERLLSISKEQSLGLLGMAQSTNLVTLGSIEVTAAAAARIAHNDADSLLSTRTLDLKSRRNLIQVLERCVKGVQKEDVMAPQMLQSIGNSIVSAASDVMLGIREIGTDSTCTKVPPLDVVKSDDLRYNTDIGTDVMMEIPEEEIMVRKCNVRDHTIERAGWQIPNLVGLVKSLGREVMSKLLDGETMNFTSKHGMLMKNFMTRLTGEEPWTVDLGENANITLPKGFCPTGTCGEKVGITAYRWPHLTYCHPKSEEMMAPDTRVIAMDIMTASLTDIVVKKLEKPIVIFIPRTTSRNASKSMPDLQRINSAKTRSTILPVVYSNFNVSHNGSCMNLEIAPLGPADRLFLMISKGRLPTVKLHRWFRMVKDLPEQNGTYEWFFPNTELEGRGDYYLGVGEFLSLSNISSFLNNSKSSVASKTILKNISVPYDIRIYSSGCYFYDEDFGEWSFDGILANYSDPSVSRCESPHLTQFGAGLFVLPNSIDFTYTFAKIGFLDNFTIYATLIVLAVIFVVLMIWARFMDRRDVRKLGATPLPDNRVEDKYLYEILVFTGNKKEAQTDSTVQFIVSGDRDESEVRTFGDGERRVFRRGGVDVFVMAESRPLGHLNMLRIWHDNSGKGPNASWYLSYIVFRDVQTGEKYEFIANQWFAVESADGQIDRLINVAGREERRSFKHLYHNSSNRSITDGHLWFSVFLRPPRSRFTRCQRVGSCFSLLFLSMLVNAMWYQRVPEQPGIGSFAFGPFNMSPEQIGVGVVSNLIVFPPALLIVFLFRKSRPRILRKSRIVKAVKDMRAKAEASGTLAPGTEGDESILQRKFIQKKEHKKRFSLPWWCVVVGWVLVLICIAVSCFFLLMYGIMFGNSKTTKWLTTLVVSFFSSVLLVQPLKIFLLSLFVSAIVKPGNLDEDDCEEDEEEPELEQDEAWLHHTKGRPRRLQAQTVDDATLVKIRDKRKEEIQIYAIVREIAFYTVFIMLILVLSYGNRDPSAYLLQRSLREAFLYEGYLDGNDFTKVTNADRLWFYMLNGLFPKLRADVLYNGKPPYGLRGFLNDHSNRIMGYATIRQVRGKEHTCRVPRVMQKVTRNCSGYLEGQFEDMAHYCRSWALPTPDTVNTSSCQVPEYRYTTSDALQNNPVWGYRDTYGGGGYVVHLTGKTEDLIQNLMSLQKNHWIDRKTRAVIIEFSTYNAQVNLFGMSRIMAEFTPGGGITPTYRFEGIRLINTSGFGVFVRICEISFILYVLYYTYRESRQIRRDGWAYFRSYWSFADLSIIGAAYSMIIVYLLRDSATNAVLEEFQRTYGNGYVNLQQAAVLNEVYLYLIGFILFVGTIKFIKLLRFNKRMGVLSTTLRHCWEDLRGFIMVFFLCFFTFVTMFFMVLNSRLFGFHNFLVAVETCFSMILGKFQFDEINEISMLVTIMFFVFIICNSWVLINLLLTVVIQTFVEVKHALEKRGNEYELMHFLLTRLKAFWGLETMPDNLCPLVSGVTSSASGPDAMRGNQVLELPQKVDAFLEHLNHMYFDGKLNVDKKALLSNRFRLGIRNGDGNVTYPAGARRKPKRYPSYPSQKRREQGQEERQGEKLDGEMSYIGPRSVNKMQYELDDF